MKSRWSLFFAFSLMVALSVATPRPLHAAAWTLAPGAAFVSLGASHYQPNRPDAPEEIKASLYAEVGVRDWLTIGGALESKADRREGFGGTTAADSGAVFFRARLHEGPHGDPFSVQVGFIRPLREPDPATGIFAEERAVDLRALYGRGFSTPWGNAFGNAEGALRLLLDDGADELRLDLTAGLRPTEDLLLMVQSFGVAGRRNPGPFGSDYDSLKIAPSIGYGFGPVTVVLGAEKTVAGRNVDHGLQLKLSIWRAF